MAHDVFFSYDRGNMNFISALRQHLQSIGVTCFLDKMDIKAGEDWQEAIANAIDSCLAVVLVLSNSTYSSDYVQREFNYAAECKKPIIPIRTEDFAITGKLKFNLAGRNWLDVFNHQQEDIQKTAAEIKRTVDGLKLSKGIPIVPVSTVESPLPPLQVPDFNPLTTVGKEMSRAEEATVVPQQPQFAWEEYERFLRESRGVLPAALTMLKSIHDYMKVEYPDVELASTPTGPLTFSSPKIVGTKKVMKVFCMVSVAKSSQVTMWAGNNFPNIPLLATSDFNDDVKAAVRAYHDGGIQSNEPALLASITEPEEAVRDSERIRFQTWEEFEKFLGEERRLPPTTISLLQFIHDHMKAEYPDVWMSYAPGALTFNSQRAVGRATVFCYLAVQKSSLRMWVGRHQHHLIAGAYIRQLSDFSDDYKAKIRVFYDQITSQGGNVPVDRT